MSRIQFLALALALAVSGAKPSAQAGIAGDWDLTFTTPQGSSNAVTVTFKQDGDVITAELVTPFGAARLSGTEEAGGSVKMTGSVAIQELALPLALSASHAGDTLNGTVAFGTLGEFPFTGKRAEKKIVEAGPPAAVDPGAGPANVSGAWTIALQVPTLGQFPLTATFEQVGDKLTGAVSSPLGPLAMTGTMTGSTLHAECVGQTPQGSFTITMNGQLGPDGLTGKASMPGFGEADWTGVRVP